MAQTTEQILIDLLIGRGLLEPDEVPAAPKAPDPESPSGGSTWGPRLGQLLREGRVREQTLEELQHVLADYQAAQTLDGSRPPASATMPNRFPIESWDRYELLQILGQGGMGVVYKARDRKLHRMVALKFIRGNDLMMTQRFLQEAQAQARIDHPGICKVLEVGEVRGNPYIAMQYVDGRPLSELHDVLPLPQKVQIIRDAAEALHAAHRLGVIHRDIKPSNLTLV